MYSLVGIHHVGRQTVRSCCYLSQKKNENFFFLRVDTRNHLMEGTKMYAYSYIINYYSYIIFLL